MGAYDRFGGDTVHTLSKYDEVARDFLGLSYQALHHASVFACVIAVMLMGLSLTASKTEDRGIIKAWIMRGAAVIILIFGIVGLLNTASSVGI